MAAVLTGWCDPEPMSLVIPSSTASRLLLLMLLVTRIIPQP